MTPHKIEAVTAVAQAWNQARFNYVVIHGLEGYPAGIGRDLDILLPAAEAGQAIAMARTVLENLGCQVVLPPAIWGHRLLATRELDWFETFELHTISALSWRNAVLASTPIASESVGPFRVDPWASFAKRVLLPLVANGARHFETRLRCLELTPAERDAAAAKLPGLLGARLTAPLLEAVMKKELPPLDSVVPGLRRQLVRNAWRRAPLRSVAATTGQVASRLAQFFSPCAPVLALVGPDGAGKSTILKELTGGDRSVFGKIVVRHWRPGLLPLLGSLAGKPTPVPGEPMAPRRKAGRFKYLRLCYYFVDFFAGYYLLDRVASARQQLVIYDRCALDMAVDPVRYGLSSSTGVRLFWRLIPKPDLVILLADEPERIHARKAELDVPEIARQLAIWNGFADAGDITATLKVDAPPEEMARRVRGLILRRLFRAAS